MPLDVAHPETHIGDVSKSTFSCHTPNTHDRYELGGLRGAESLNYMKGRFQLPAYAKFNRPDPMRDWDWLAPHTINLYEYTYNDPINSFDPDGLSPVSVFAKAVAKQGLKKAAKEAIEAGIKSKLKAYASKKWAKTFVDDAMTAVDVASGQAWWEYGVELIPVAGDVYGGVKLSKSAHKLWKVQQKFEALSGAASKAVANAWTKLDINKKLTGKGSDLVEKAVKKFNNQGDHLTDSDVAGAVRDLFGEGVKKVDGSTFDHLKEVQESMSGMGNRLAALRQQIDSGAFDGDALKAAESLYSEVQKRLDSLKNALNQAQQAAEAL
jgi:RHS repeat-associated protein